MSSRYATYLLPTLATITILIFWELIVHLFSIPAFILPAPSAILGSLGNWGMVVWQNSLVTLQTTLIGFAIALFTGLVLGFLIGYSKLVYTTLYPILVGFNTIPKVAIVPLLAIWFGIGTIPAVMTAFLLAFFTIAVNVSLGLSTVEPEMRDVLKSLGASQWEVFQKVGFPHSLPYLFASLKIAISQAFIGSVISETVASDRGIGYLIVTATSNFDIALAFLCLLTLAVMGIALYAIFAVVEQRTVHWLR
ncbi:MAG: ABC transporter permease [Oculatellaceae cyanobacterium Prado106]|nr:ABC transporter permease [Oculatellaceae cyanobacterium Prado106]